MARMVKRLSQLEIDEVSLVDRPANQHGLVAIAKNDQEDTMDLYDEQGNPVSEDDLEPGMRVYDGEGTEYVYTETDAADGDDGDDFDDDAQGAFDDDRELAGVGKGMASNFGAGLAYAGGQARSSRAGQAAGRAAGWAGRNRKAVGAAAGTGAAGYGAGRVGKSFGDQVLEELSKALNEPERDAVISKALNQVEQVSKRNAALEAVVAEMLQEREHEDFVELAKSYDGLPADEDELADILHSAATVLRPDQLQALDRILTGASEVGKALYDEVGYGGQGDVGILGQVMGLSEEAVIKNAQSGVSPEQAMTAIFDVNPEAYDQYLDESR